MSKKIVLEKATRIEGDADIHIEIEEGHVKTARFMVQDFRGFEKFIFGRQVESVPHMVSRICGLCSTAHQIASLRAVEDALGVNVSPSVNELRTIALLGERISSHALSYFFLSQPDLLKTSKGVFDLLKDHPAIAKDAFFLRKSGHRILEIVGKRAVHSVAMGVGRFYVTHTREDMDALRRIANGIKETCLRLIGHLDEQHRRERTMPFPIAQQMNFLAYDDDSGQGRFRIFGRDGETTETFSIDGFSDHVSEMRVDWSFAKFPYLASLGFPDGIILVGPLSRLFQEHGVLGDPDLADFELTKSLKDYASLHLDDFDVCRLLEIYIAAKQIIHLVDDVDLAEMNIANVDLETSGTGIGVVEAPRGTLVHSYVVNRGIIERIRFLVATQFNNAFINLVLRDLAKRNIEGEGLSEKGEELITRCVRVFDPCLTCATH